MSEQMAATVQPVRYLSENGVDQLTPREREVLREYVHVGVYKLIAHELGLSAETIKNYATSIISKLHVSTLGQAAVLFDRIENERQPSWPDVERRSGRDRRRRPS